MAFLKKICRDRNTEQFREMLALISKVETGQVAFKLKDQIKKIFSGMKPVKEVVGPFQKARELELSKGLNESGRKSL